MNQQLKEKIIKVIIDSLGAKKVAELTLQGWDFYKIADQLLSLFSQFQAEAVREIRGVKERFRCAACDGARCEHTQCCQALSQVLSILKEKV